MRWADIGLEAQRPLIAISICLFVMCLFLVRPISGLPPTTIAPLYFLWDVGPTPSTVDQGDVIYDLSNGCNSPALPVNVPGVIEGRILPHVTIPTVQETVTELERVGLPVPPLLYIRGAWLLESFRGRGKTVFVLLPELHRPLETEGGLVRYLSVNFSRSIFASALIEASRSASVLNVREGVVGEPWKLPNLKFRARTPMTRVLEMALIYGAPSTFAAIGNAYADAANVYSSLLEQYELNATDILLNLGGYDGKKTFEETFGKAQTTYVWPLNKHEFDKTFADLRRMRPMARAIYKDKVCGWRSRSMAERAEQLVLEKNAVLVFFTYGAAHHADISSALRTSNMSFITLMGRRNTRFEARWNDIELAVDRQRRDRSSRVTPPDGKR